MPPLPNWTERPFQLEASATEKLIGLPAGVVSIGAIEPFTEQYGPPPPLPAAFQRGSLSVTAPTNSPMEDAGMLLPSFADVQSVSEIIWTAADG
jgi:hypothetical protein